MSINGLEFDDERNRIIVNLRQHYEVWMQAQQSLGALTYGMKWKTINGADYLYALRDRTGSGSSVGRRSSATEKMFEDYQREKSVLTERVSVSADTLENSCQIYRALHLPLLAPQAAAILRQADLNRLLGTNLIVIGTNAMVAYSLESTQAFAGDDMTTDDFDLAWTGSDALEMAVIWPMLKAVDGTYTVNTERPFQARNAKGYEVELLTAPSRATTLARRDQPTPTPLPEQEWLLKGRFTDHVVVARDGSPARLVVPDPRWFALQKLWMSEQAKRNPAKRPKDARQGHKLLGLIATRMPQYPLDRAFEAEIPEELSSYYSAWKAGQQPLSPRLRKW